MAEGNGPDVPEENAGRFAEDFQAALEETPEIVKEVLQRYIAKTQGHHSIVSFDHYKVGGDRQGIMLNVECPETGKRHALPYSPKTENVAECSCGAFITLGTCQPVQDADLRARDLDIAERSEEKREAVAELLDVDPDALVGLGRPDMGGGDCA